MGKRFSVEFAISDDNHSAESEALTQGTKRFDSLEEALRYAQEEVLGGGVPDVKADENRRETREATVFGPNYRELYSCSIERASDGKGEAFTRVREHIGEGWRYKHNEYLEGLPAVKLEAKPADIEKATAHKAD